jgi:hypothetical protein
MQVLSLTGIHTVKVMYCGCAQVLPKHVQLLRAGLFPATEKIPKTAATFDFLETYSKLSYVSKTNVYDFYKFVVHRGDPLQRDHGLVSRIDLLNYDSFGLP